MTKHDLNCTLAPDLKKNPFYSNSTSAKTATHHGNINPSSASGSANPHASPRQWDTPSPPRCRVQQTSLAS